MKENEKLQECFRPLEEELYRIKDNPQAFTRSDPQYPIDHIVSNGIFGFNFEDSKDYLEYFLGKIALLLKDIPSIISNLPIKDETQGSVFASSGIILISSSEIKKTIQGAIIDSLTHYQGKLKAILEEILTSQGDLGSDRFANAGTKIKLDLTVEDIGGLFRALLVKKILSLERNDGTALTQKDLANFISKNFECDKKKDISASSLEILLSPNKPYSATLEKVISALSKMVSA